MIAAVRRQQATGAGRRCRRYIFMLRGSQVAISGTA